MKKLKLFFALFAMLALGVGNAWGAEAKFGTDWNSVFGTSYSGTISSVKANQLTLSGIVNSVSLVATNGTSTNGYVKTSDWRLYNGYTLTLTAPANHNITAISAKKGGKAIAGISTTVGDLSIPSGGATMSWTGSSNQVVFKVTTTMGFSEITVTYSEGSGSTPEPEPDPDPTPDPTPDPEEPETPGIGDDATMTAGTNGSACKVNGKDGIKVGSSSKGGDMQITVPAGATMLHVYAAAWKGVTNLSLNITPTSNVTTTSIALQANDGIANSTPFTLSGDEADYLFDIPLQNITAETTLTFTSSTTKRFVVWGATYETASGDEPSTPTPSVSVAPTSHTFATTNVGETATQEFTITTENTTATLTASIDDNINYAVSAIDGNKVTVTYQPQSAATHPAVLTVKAGEEATATVNLTGKAVQALEGTWILVTDASSLNVGDKIIIAAKESEVALSTTQASNNRPEVAITKNDNTITATSETQVLTLQAGNKENTLALYTGDGYLYAASSGSNWLRTETTLSDNSSWSIAVAADGTATLIAQGDNTRNTLYYNKNNNIFSCYSNAQQPIALYKNTNGKQLAGLAYATTKYLTKLGDAFTTPTLTNPNSLTVTYSSSDNNVATVDNTGTVTIKAAGVVVITAAFAGDASYLEGSAKYTLCVTEHAGTEADPYSVADARRVIDVMETATDVYATGVVSEIVTAYNASYGNITYNISVDGTTTADQLQAYNGKSYSGANFTSADDIKVGDEVVVKGNLKKYNTTYEFDKENQLVSLVRNKAQADLAYAETELTANVGEDFAEPTLSNPYSLSITYSSSNTTLATVNATTGEVSILAAGKVTITASSAADATYAAGSASYNITITDPSLAVAQLPFTYKSGKADIETTAGITQEGLGSDYTSAGSPKLKFDHTGDNIVICFGSQADELSYDIKGNPSQGTFSCTFAVQESEDGSTYTDLVTYTTLETTTTNKTHKLAPASRYVKFVFTEKSNGNVALGNISITKPDLRAEAGIAWDPATVSLTVGDAFTAPTLSNPNGLSGITFASSNEELATVNNAGAITLVSGKTGTATITATFADGHADYKPAEATCVITVSPKSEKVVILAQYNGQWYALKNVEETAGKVLAALPVNYVGGKLYNVEEADKATIEWQRAAVTDGIIFKNGENYIYGTAGSTDLKLSTTECAWTLDGSTYKIGNRTFIYRAQANGFKNYNATTTPGTDDYSNLPVVTAPVYATGDAYGRSVNLGEDGYRYGTICLPFGSSNYEGAQFFECVGKEEGKVYIASVTTLVAGTPYIFLASATEVAVYGDGTTAATPGNSNGLYGTFDDETVVALGDYILLNNELRPSDGSAKVNANRAYIVMGEVPVGAPQQMPGRRYIGMSVQGENAETGFENITAPAGKTVKAIVNGQLIIIRDGEMYNAQGQKL